MSAVEVPMLQIQTIPALGGEIDVLKAIQLLPGVQSASEGSTGVYVRGGGPDENLIMLAHDSETKTTTVEALPAIIEHYLRLGYSFEAITPDTMVFHHEPVN